MANTRLFPEGARSTVPAAISSTATTLTLTSAASFGTIGSGQQIDCIIIDSGNPGFSPLTPLATPFEYAVATAISGNVVTITRGQYGSAAASFYAGATISASITGDALENPGVVSLTVGDSVAEGVGGVVRKFYDNTRTTNSGANGGWTFDVPAGDWGLVKIRVDGNSQGAADKSWVRLNGDGGANYYSTDAFSADNLSEAGSEGNRASISAFIGDIPAGTTNLGAHDVEIAVPAMATYHSGFYRTHRIDGPAAGDVWFVSGAFQYAIQAAVTTIEIFNSTGFATGSRCQAWIFP